MKKLFLFLLLIPAGLFAQNKLELSGTAPSFYLAHKVAAKESVYSLARMYNVTPKELAAFNKISIDKGLILGQALKIPVTSHNFLQSGNAGADEVTVPLYHTVQAKEGLFRISTAYNKVLLADLRKWNNLTSDVLSTGTPIIIGFLKVKKAESSLAAQAEAPKTEVKEPKTDPGPVIFDPPQPPVKNNEDNQPPVKTPKADPPKPVANNEPIQPVTTKGTGGNFNGGAFEAYYSETGKKEKGMAGVFKSTSGWEDGKYYCLHNSAPTGTIVKIINNATGKSIYAKVLDIIPDIKQNAGLVIRISNAAADILGVVGEVKFDCSLSY